jgi:hypothetical protein
MPEVLLCTGCKKRIDPEDEEFVIPNKSEAPERHWEYWHVECWDDKGKAKEGEGRREGEAGFT